MYDVSVTTCVGETYIAVVSYLGRTFEVVGEFTFSDGVVTVHTVSAVDPADTDDVEYLNTHDSSTDASVPIPLYSAIEEAITEALRPKETA